MKFADGMVLRIASDTAEAELLRFCRESDQTEKKSEVALPAFDIAKGLITMIPVKNLDKRVVCLLLGFAALCIGLGVVHHLRVLSALKTQKLIDAEDDLQWQLEKVEEARKAKEWDVAKVQLDNLSMKVAKVCHSFPDSVQALCCTRRIKVLEPIINDHYQFERITRELDQILHSTPETSAQEEYEKVLKEFGKR